MLAMSSEWQGLVEKTNKWSGDYIVNRCLNDYMLSAEKLKKTQKTRKDINLFADLWGEHREKIKLSSLRSKQCMSSE